MEGIGYIQSGRLGGFKGVVLICFILVCPLDYYVLTPSSIAHSIIVLDILFNGSNSRQPLCNLSTAYLKHRAWIINTHQDLRASIILVILSFISRSDPLTTNNTKGIEAFQVDAWRCSTCKRGFIIHHALYCRTTLMSHLQHLARLTLFHIHHPLWRLHFYISIFLVMILGIHLPA